MITLSRSGNLYKTLRRIRSVGNRAILRLPGVHKTAYVHSSVRAAKDLVAEEYVYVSRNGVIGPMTRIGRYTMLAAGVSVIGGDHVTDRPGVPIQFAGRPEQQPTTIGSDVWVGANVIIMRGVTIGEGAIVAAGAVVTRDVAPYEVVAGIPAREISQRFPDEADREAHSACLRGRVMTPNFAEKRS